VTLLLFFVLLLIIDSTNFARKQVLENSDILESVVHFMVIPPTSASWRRSKRAGLRIAVKSEWRAGILLATRPATAGRLLTIRR
jgi:hypothetical protein